MQTMNAKIEYTMLGFQDHGIMTGMLYLDYGGTGQSFGGYNFGPTISDLEAGTGYGSTWVATVLNVVGVDKWEDLRGAFVRVIAEQSKVYAIGNIIEDKWFAPGEANPRIQKLIEIEEGKKYV